MYESLVRTRLRKYILCCAFLASELMFSSYLRSWERIVPRKQNNNNNFNTPNSIMLEFAYSQNVTFVHTGKYYTRPLKLKLSLFKKSFYFIDLPIHQSL